MHTISDLKIIILTEVVHINLEVEVIIKEVEVGGVSITSLKIRCSVRFVPDGAMVP
jgi:hypothetical protein